jgi:hypothetical protein
MPNWLYTYFGEVVKPLITMKEKRQLSMPASFTDNGTLSPPSFWIYPPEPAILLSRRRFDPTLFYRPRIFLWLPHFLVDDLHCPACKTAILEKNGALRPRRIVDSQDCFYLISWSYYCRKGCKSHFAGWGHAVLDSLPRHLRLAFPAILSHRSGISRSVMTQLRVGNQHKMGPSGVKSLLLEMHTLRFNTLHLQYAEAIFEVVSGREAQGSKNTLHSYISAKFPAFGNFSDPQGYAGFVPGERYLAEMMNKAIERDENDANQHTACLAPDQIAIDDSHKASFEMNLFYLIII